MKREMAKGWRWRETLPNTPVGYESGGPCQRETESAEPRLGTSRVSATVNHLGRPTYPALGEPAIYLMVQ